MATVTSAGLPDVAFVYYIIRDNFEIYFVTEKNTEKYKNLQLNNSVTMIVVDAKSREIAKIKGRAFMISDKTKVASAEEDFNEKMNEGESVRNKILPILERKNGDLVIVKIRPADIRMTVYGAKKMSEQMIIFKDNGNL